MASPLAPSHSWGTPPVDKYCKHKNNGKPGFSLGEPYRAQKSMVSLSMSAASTHIPEGNIKYKFQLSSLMKYKC